MVVEATRVLIQCCPKGFFKFQFLLKCLKDQASIKYNFDTQDNQDNVVRGGGGKEEEKREEEQI